MSKVQFISLLDTSKIGLTKPEVVNGERISYSFVESDDGTRKPV